MGTHSLYLRVLAEQGWLGITALLMLIATIIVFLLRVIRFPSSPFQRSLATIVLASLIAILANSFFIDTLHWRHFWLLLGLAWAIRESSVFVKEKVR
jgi:O-antigen ligase